MAQVGVYLGKLLALLAIKIFVVHILKFIMPSLTEVKQIVGVIDRFYDTWHFVNSKKVLLCDIYTKCVLALAHFIVHYFLMEC